MLLRSELARELYSEYAKEMPIYDYHSHVSAEDIYKSRRYSNITQMWLEGDHYKWRLMRLCGVDEDYVSGYADDKDKFSEFAKILPRCIGNPVYTWCHMELEKYFGYTGRLCADTADEVWRLCSEKFAGGNLGVKDIISMSNVKFIGTTNDPCEDLEYHKKLSEENLSFTVAPTFRPDELLNIENADFPGKIESLARASGMAIDGIKTFKSALRKRMNYFCACGCLSADHGCEQISYVDATSCEAERIFIKALDGASLSDRETDMFKTHMLIFCAQQYYELEWVMQIHFNCIRNPRSRGYKSVGSDAGFDCIRKKDSSDSLALLLDKINEKGMPKIILYSLEPSDNAYLDVLSGSFAGGEPLGRVCHGAAWWFNDNKFGIENHIRNMASLGVFGNFVGMLTDSRSFLSYVRHDYFRRILCSMLSDFVLSGEYPDDKEGLGCMIRDICYNNSKNFFEGKTNV